MIIEGQLWLQEFSKREQFASYRQVDVLCPFYNGDNDKNKIRCEGIIGDCSTFYFRSASELDAHMQRFCCGKYNQCPVARTLNDMYERGEKT